MPDEMRWSFVLIGLAIAAAGAVGVLLPSGQRWAVLLPLIAGMGVGIIGLALGAPGPHDSDNERAYEQVFLWSSIAGFATVAVGLALVWLRATPRPAPALPESHF